MAGGLLTSLRFARRELRGGLRGFRILVACLAVGVAAIAGVGSLTQSMQGGLARDARNLLGGDIEIQIFGRPLPPEVLAFVEARAVALSHIVTMRAQARSPEARSLVELKIVDDAYPLVGAMALDPGAALTETLAGNGAVADELLFTRLGIAPGDAITLGKATLSLRAAILDEPDRLTGGITLGPRLMIGASSLEATGLVRPGTLLRHRYRIGLLPGEAAATWVKALELAYPDGGWRIRDLRDAHPSLKRQLDRLGLFLTLVGLAALLVGGIGVAAAVNAYLDGKVRTIAMLKCVGAPNPNVFSIFLAQILALAGLGILIGLVIGVALPPLADLIAGDLMPVPLALGIYWLAIAKAAGLGLLTTLAFTLWPLGRAARVKPGVLLRSSVAPAPRWPGWPVFAATIGAIAALAGLAIVSAAVPMIALWFVGGAAAALVIFRGAAWVIVFLAKRAGRPRQTALRLGLANLTRPGAPTATVAVSLGTGLAVLIAVTLVEGNMRAQIWSQGATERPTYFFLDIQPDQTAAFDALLDETPGADNGRRVPMLRGRIARIGDTPVRDAKIAPGSQWVVQSDVGLTYAAHLPGNAEIVAGEWWPADYAGEPLISLDADVARDFGIGLGDELTINILGRDVAGRIASLREIDWTDFDINFLIMFSPGVLEGAPQTHLATVRTSSEAEPVLERALAADFANVTPVPVRAILDTLDTLLRRVSAAIAAAAGLTLVSGALVLAGAIAAGEQRRVHEAVVLKVLGARRIDLVKAFLVEYLLLGLVAAALAAGIGTIAAYGLVTQVMDAKWTFLPAEIAITAAACVGVTVLFGFAGTWRALGQKAAPLLRTE